jgi:hypothetical protein
LIASSEAEKVQGLVSFPRFKKKALLFYSPQTPKNVIIFINKSDPIPFSYSDPPTHHPPRGYRFCFAGQGAPKKKKEKSDVPTYLPTFFEVFFEIFRFDFRKYFYGAFGLLMQRNGQKR